ncbi:nicotinate-nucleotide adenylyltransferase [Marinobacter zhejiangensis]|uniref:Probable nicotinate-nucleotide adenylyltransferase n=1 Tax=Marinobacter zhejiangensis TaxID=488535 RepID=A0A1I4TDZ7_9GAMM|nr:nicotinate-nucleotide adenylyltransferase [Marinobacter zhejiangensis]SFM74797.1 nicotinate-nucleotide adenylyltransferase [Marinobacter zhejiangensis]
MRVIYGGTFDPVHNGHLRLAVELREMLAVPELALVPCHIPPHRAHPGAGSQERLELLQLAVAGEPGLVVDDRELARGGASYTADTLRQVRSEVGADEPVVLVMGADAFAGFDRWRDWQAIPELAHVLVVARPGYAFDPDSVPAGLLRTRGCGSAKELASAPCGLFLYQALPLLDISATAVREKICKGLSPRYLLPDVVWQEIQRRELYGFRLPQGNL